MCVLQAPTNAGFSLGWLLHAKIPESLLELPALPLAQNPRPTYQTVAPPPLIVLPGLDWSEWVGKKAWSFNFSQPKLCCLFVLQFRLSFPPPFFSLLSPATVECTLCTRPPHLLERLSLWRAHILHCMLFPTWNASVHAPLWMPSLLLSPLLPLIFWPVLQ